MENEIIRKAKLGDTESVLALFEQYERLIHKVGKKFSTVGSVDKESLVGLAMTKAIKNYDLENAKSKFFTYFHVLLYNEFKMFIRSQNTQKNSGQTISFEELRNACGVKYETDLVQLIDESVEEVTILKIDLKHIVKKHLMLIKNEKVRSAVIDVMLNEYSLSQSSKKNGVPKMTIHNNYVNIKERIKRDYLEGEQ